MKTAYLILSTAGAVAHGNVLNARATNQCTPGNNCQRGVTGSGNKPPLSSRLADCSSFMRVTVTPATTTLTVTRTTTAATVSTTVTRQGAIVVRQVTVSPNRVPTYATYCTGSSAYSSACSCAGVTRWTSTAPSPVRTVTVTTTATATATSTAIVCSPPRTLCGGICIDTSANNNNCGGCGNVCPQYSSCAGSTCVPLPVTCSNPILPAACSIPGQTMQNLCGTGQECGYCLADVNGNTPTCIAFNSGQCGECTTNADCTAQAGGYCAPACCGPVGGLCAYPTYFCSHLPLKRDLSGQFFGPPGLA